MTSKTFINIVYSTLTQKSCYCCGKNDITNMFHNKNLSFSFRDRIFRKNRMFIHCKHAKDGINKNTVYTCKEFEVFSHLYFNSRFTWMLNEGIYL